MEKEMKLKKRLKGLLSLVLSMTMLFGMTLGVYANNYDYKMSANTNDFSFKDSVGNNVTGTISNGKKIYLYSSGGSTNVIYVNNATINTNGSEYTIEGPTPTYSFTYEIDEVNKKGILRLTSIYPPQTNTHTHTYEWQTVKEATETESGEEAYICSCGDVAERRPISAEGIYWKNCLNKIKNAKTGDTVVLENDIWHSYPKRILEAIAERKDINVKITLKYKGVKYEITIPAGTEIDTSLDWYGPEKLKQMFGFAVIE